jgi:thiamine transporter ThiT
MREPIFVIFGRIGTSMPVNVETTEKAMAAVLEGRVSKSGSKKSEDTFLNAIVLGPMLYLIIIFWSQYYYCFWVAKIYIFVINHTNIACEVIEHYICTALLFCC